jgi:hypothetical protein
MGYPEPLTEEEHTVVEAMRGGAEYRRTKKTVLDIESTLALYDVPIMAPLSDSVLRVCEQRDNLGELLRKCLRVVGSDTLSHEIEEALDELP